MIIKKLRLKDSCKLTSSNVVTKEMERETPAGSAIAPLDNIRKDIGLTWDECHAITTAFGTFMRGNPEMEKCRDIKKFTMQFVGQAVFFPTNPFGITEEQRRKILFTTVLITTCLAGSSPDVNKEFESILKSLGDDGKEGKVCS